MTPEQMAAALYDELLGTVLTRDDWIRVVAGAVHAEREACAVAAADACTHDACIPTYDEPTYGAGGPPKPEVEWCEVAAAIRARA